MRGNELDTKTSPLLMGLDAGTTSIKAIVFTPSGEIVAQTSVPTVTHYPHPGAAYYDAEEIWQLAARAIRGAVAGLPAGSGRAIASVAVASMGEAGVAMDERGHPLADSMAWFDTRPTPEAEWLGKTIGKDRLFSISGLSLQPIWSLAKLLWLRKHQPRAFGQTHRWLNMADWIAYRLCGVAATDYSLASRTHALNIQHLRWADDLLEEVGVPPELFAPLVGSGQRLDTVSRQSARLTGLPVTAVVSAGGHDHVCGALGAGVTEPGDLLNSLGTAEAWFLPLDRPMNDPKLGEQGYTQGAHVVPGRYYAFGGQYTTGAAIDWIRDVVGGGERYRDLIAEAEVIPPGSLGVGFLPYLRLAAPPYDDPNARGAFVGLRTDTGRGAVLRAVFEGLAMESQSSLDPLLPHAGITSPNRIVAIGGVTRNRLLMRIKATLLNTPLEIAEVDEATALGAAMLGGIGAGIYRDAADASRTVQGTTMTIEPEPAWIDAYSIVYERIYRQIYPALRDLHHTIDRTMIELMPIERGADESER